MILHTDNWGLEINQVYDYFHWEIATGSVKIAYDGNLGYNMYAEDRTT